MPCAKVECLPRPDHRDLAAALVVKAQGDELALTRLLDSDVPDDILGFHAQQAVEKLLKAVCAYRNVEFPYTHDIARLLEVLESDGLPIPDEVADADVLTAWAVELRYSAAPVPRLDRNLARDIVSTVLTWVTQQTSDLPGR